MLPLQEIEIKTKNLRVFHVHLEKWAPDLFECKLAAIDLGPQQTANAIFGPFSKGKSAIDAYKFLIQGVINSLRNLDSTDQISIINNPCNTEFIKKIDQEVIVGTSVTVLVNGK